MCKQTRRPSYEGRARHRWTQTRRPSYGWPLERMRRAAGGVRSVRVKAPPELVPMLVYKSKRFWGS